MNRNRELFLSLREIEVLEAIKQGHTSSTEISQQLGIAEITVRNHLTSIYRRLGIGGSISTKKIRALLRAIALGEIEEPKPTVDVEQTKIYQLGNRDSSAKRIPST